MLLLFQPFIGGQGDGEPIKVALLVVNADIATRICLLLTTFIWYPILTSTHTPMFLAYNLAATILFSILHLYGASLGHAMATTSIQGETQEAKQAVQSSWRGSNIWWIGIIAAATKARATYNSQSSTGEATACSSWLCQAGNPQKADVLTENFQESPTEILIFRADLNS